MTITIDLLEAPDIPCDLCCSLDDSGGIRIVDDQQVSKVFCRQCTIGVVLAALPDGRVGTHVTKPARATAALALAGA